MKELLLLPVSRNAWTPKIIFSSSCIHLTRLSAFILLTLTSRSCGLASPNPFPAAHRLSSQPGTVSRTHKQVLKILVHPKVGNPQLKSIFGLFERKIYRRNSCTIFQCELPAGWCSNKAHFKWLWWCWSISGKWQNCASSLVVAQKQHRI